ncbi:MAG: MFS transporter, partial [Gemmataceae bacterium]
SFGLLASLAPVTLEDADLSPTMIGLNTSLYYLGVALASPWIPWLLGRARLIVLLGMLMDGLATITFPLASDLSTWHLLRFLGGVGTAMSLIPMETLVNAQAAPEERASRFGIYAFCGALGLTIGSAGGVPLMPYSPCLPYFLGGGVTLLAMGFVAWGVPSRMTTEADESTGRHAWYRERFSFGAGGIQGFLEGGTFAFLTLYLLEQRQVGESLAGLLIGVLFTGVLVAQLPLCWLADRWGLTRSVIGCLIMLLVGSLLVPWLGIGLLFVALFVLGACCGALYPLGLALLGERVPPTLLARANAYYLTANCLGSLAGPLVIGLASEVFGLSALFGVGAAGVAMVLLLAPWRTIAPAAPSRSSCKRRAA